MSDNCYVCGRPAHEECAECGQLICKKHGRKVDDVYLCVDCFESYENEDDFDDVDDLDLKNHFSAYDSEDIY